MEKIKKTLSIIGIVMLVLVIGFSSYAMGYKEKNQLLQDKITDLKYQVNPQEESKEAYRQFDIKLDVIEPNSRYGWDSAGLLEHPNNDKGLTLQYYSEEFISKHDVSKYALGSVALAIYTDYLEEDVRCEVEEYYGSSKNTVFTIDLFDNSYKGVPWNVEFVELAFESDIRPEVVKYFVKCEGLESGNTASNTFHLNLNYEQV